MGKDKHFWAFKKEQEVVEIHNQPRPYETQHLKDEDIINSYIQWIDKPYIDLFVRNIDLELGDPFVLIPSCDREST